MTSPYRPTPTNIVFAQRRILSLPRTTPVPLPPGIQTAIENGTIPDGDDVQFAIGELQKLVETGEECAAPAIEFCREQGAVLVAELTPERRDQLLTACKRLGCLGLETFQNLGKDLARFAEDAGLELPKALKNVDWDALQNDAGKMAAAAEAAVKEAGCAAGALLLQGWDKLSEEAQALAAGGGGGGDQGGDGGGGGASSSDPSAIRASLARVAQTGKGLSAGACQAVGAAVGQLKDESVHILQKAVAACARSGLDRNFSKLWDKLQAEVLPALQEAGRAVSSLDLWDQDISLMDLKKHADAAGVILISPTAAMGAGAAALAGADFGAVDDWAVADFAQNGSWSGFVQFPRAASPRGGELVDSSPGAACGIEEKIRREVLGRGRANLRAQITAHP